ncbi:MAG: S-methyl-5-thioribose-1-phosphate isomerase [Deltaproteobacteria bacterium]|nr:S-methyl-5-thioribose-1-phosphate isomerase [Deltaproteobacteria bacterium]
MTPETISWKNDHVVMIDQRILPHKVNYVVCRSHYDVAKAIKNLVIRGAPAIGCAAAMGMALGALRIKGKGTAIFLKELKKIGGVLVRSRPTAVNLSWAINRMLKLAQENAHQTVEELQQTLVAESLKILAEDIDTNRRMGLNGESLINDGATILTHCNAGALATGGYGTALGVIRAAVEAGKRVKVIADETRPFLQGSRLTAFELTCDDIPVTLITDNMAGHVMKCGYVDAVIVGADRIAANGDTANKIGTYMVSVLAKEHAIPFYVAAPLSTIDLSIKNGGLIPIEERDQKEVTHLSGKIIAPQQVAALNFAFDVTPAANVTAFITEEGIIRPPYQEAFSSLFNSR